MKRNLKILVMLFMISIFIIIFESNVNAVGIFDQAHAFLEEGRQEVGTLAESGVGADRIKDTFSKITGLTTTTKTGFEGVIDILWSIGLLTIFVSSIILGIKYMLVLPDEKSRIKQATTPYIMGVVIIFGALTIWRFVIVVLDGSLN